MSAQPAPAMIYRHGAAPPCTHAYLTEPVVRMCRAHRLGRVLDVGCGNGSLCRALADAGIRVTGMDPSSEGVAHARQTVPEGTFYELGVYDPPDLVVESDFDGVVSTEVIEHLDAPDALLRLAAAKLKPGGWLLISTPYHGYLKNVAIALLGRWDAHHAPLWEGGHIKFWSRRTLGQLLERNGFRVAGWRGIGRMPWLWKSMIMNAQYVPGGWTKR